MTAEAVANLKCPDKIFTNLLFLGGVDRLASGGDEATGISRDHPLRMEKKGF